MTLKRCPSAKARHDDVNYALRTGGEAVLAKPRVLSYLSHALHHKPDAEHEIRRAALLEALSVNLARYMWITVNRNLHTKHLSLDFHLTRISADSRAAVPPYLGSLLTAVARAATDPAHLPSISIIDKNRHLHLAKAFSDGTYTHLALDPSYEGDAVQTSGLQSLVDSISATASSHSQRKENS